MARNLTLGRAQQGAVAQAGTVSLFPNRASSEEGEVGLKAAPTTRGDVGSTQDLTPPGPSPSCRSGWKIRQLRAHPSDMPGCHPLPRHA